MSPTYEILSLIDRLINERLAQNEEALRRSDAKGITRTAGELVGMLEIRQKVSQFIQECERARQGGFSGIALEQVDMATANGHQK